MKVTHVLLFIITISQSQGTDLNVSQSISTSADTIHTALLHGGADIGYYYVNIYIGTPPKKQTVIVDTGSSTTTFPCNDCSDCGKHFDEKFDLKKSSTAEVIQCHQKVGENECGQCDAQQRCSFAISFAEGSSLKGYFIKDYVLFGDHLYDLYQETQEYFVTSKVRTEDENIINREHFKAVFGCTTLETNLFRTQQADGIMGLSPRTNTPHDLPNVVDGLFSQFNKQGQNLSFSLCYNNIVGGYMSIGGYDKHRHEQNALTHTLPYYREGNLFRIKINDVKIGNVSLDLDSSEYQLGQGSFVDSGTTLVYAHPAIFSAFQQKMDRHCNSNIQNCPNLQMIGGQQCFKYTKVLTIIYQQSLGTLEEFYDKFPTVYFNLENDFIFDWKPSDYLYIETSITQEKDMYCFPLIQIPNRFILGGIWMRSWDILFDRQAEQMQFTRSKCSNSKVHAKPHNLFKDPKAEAIDSKSQIIQNPQINDSNHTLNKPNLTNDFILSQKKKTLEYLIYGILSFFAIGVIICSYFLIKILLQNCQQYNKVNDSLPIEQVELDESYNVDNITTIHKSKQHRDAIKDYEQLDVNIYNMSKNENQHDHDIELEDVEDEEQNEL